MRKRKSIKIKKIRIGDISISYLINADYHPHKKTILFLHGFPFNKNTWENQVEELSPIANCIAMDTRGHGLTTSGHGFFSIDVFAKDLIEFVNKLQLKDVILCGISMGGYIALRAQEIHPDMFRALILCDTHPFEDTKEQKQHRFDTIQSVLHHGKRPFSIGFITKIFTQESIEKEISEIELIRSCIRRNSTRTICATLLALASRTDTSENLSQISVPCLLIRGKEDKITSEEAMKSMKEKIKTAELFEIEDAGHLPNLEKPDVFNEKIKEFTLKLSN